MDILYTIIAFIISLGILITIHEFGHFWVAKITGVKVLCFSIGFGKPIFTWTSSKGTKFILAMIPLGGFVKMLDEREGKVAPHELHRAFNRQSVWKRIAIVIAGPSANFILAILALWLMFILGIQTIIPLIGSIIPNSPANIAGMNNNEEIIKVNDNPVYSWNDINLSLASLIGSNDFFTITTRSEANTYTYKLIIKHWPANLKHDSLLDAVGIKIWYPELKPIIGKIIPDLPADKAGIMPDDKIIAINHESVKTWQDVVHIIHQHANQELSFTIARKNQKIQLKIKPIMEKNDNKEKFGKIGIIVKPTIWSANEIRDISYNPLLAITKAITETWKMASITIFSIYNMITGILSVRNLSGPITIAKIAGSSMKSGLENFLYFLAMLSLSLGIINLLPIPMLDGGHLFFYLIEIIKGRPISEKIQELCLKIGMVFIICIMILAIYNDLSRF